MDADVTDVDGAFGASVALRRGAVVVVGAEGFFGFASE
jgi:hypothetical protein